MLYERIFVLAYLHLLIKSRALKQMTTFFCILRDKFTVFTTIIAWESFYLSLLKIKDRS